MAPTSEPGTPRRCQTTPEPTPTPAAKWQARPVRHCLWPVGLCRRSGRPPAAPFLSCSAHSASPTRGSAASRYCRASSTGAARRCCHLPCRGWWGAAPAPPRGHDMRAGCGLRSADAVCLDYKCPVPRGHPDRARICLCLRNAGAPRFHDHLSDVRHREGRDDADRRLSVFLRVHRLRRAPPS